MSAYKSSPPAPPIDTKNVRAVGNDLVAGVTIGGLIAGMVVGLPLLLLAYYLRRRSAGSDKVHPSPPPGRSDQFVVQPPAAPTASEPQSGPEPSGQASADSTEAMDGSPSSTSHPRSHDVSTFCASFSESPPLAGAGSTSVQDDSSTGHRQERIVGPRGRIGVVGRVRSSFKMTPPTTPNGAPASQPSLVSRSSSALSAGLGRVGSSLARSLATPLGASVKQVSVRVRFS